MQRTNTALWRIAFLSGLGVLPAACGGRANEPAGSVDPGTPLGTDGRAPQPTNKPSPTPLPSTPTSPAPDVVVPPLEPALVCRRSSAYLVGGIDTGLERCDDGRIHRRVPLTCTSRLPREGAVDAGVPAPAASDAGTAAPDAGTPDPSLGTAPGVCTSDSDCTSKPFGHCEMPLNLDGRLILGKQCEYGCLADGDCESGYLCQCGDPVGTCVAAQCHFDADCGDGLLCALGASYRSGCGDSYVFACESPGDSCRIDQQCQSSTGTAYCQFSGGERVCSAYPDVVCGRPFLVEGSARLASLERTSAWLGAGACPDCSRLNPEQRRLLADGWSQLGLMEHASVAAFARFTLQLLSLGAPAALVEQSQRALADELLHARLCFDLASGYADEPIGPGPLPTEHALDLGTLEDIAALTLHEGCVGETLAALEASEARAAARDPAVREVLTRIEADERRHAELAWRFVSWALKTGGPGVRRRIQRELASLLAVASEMPPSHTFDSSEHGILSAAQRAELRAAALHDVVLPCAGALLGVEFGAGPALAAV